MEKHPKRGSLMIVITINLALWQRRQNYGVSIGFSDYNVGGCHYRGSSFFLYIVAAGWASNVVFGEEEELFSSWLRNVPIQL